MDARLRRWLGLNGVLFVGLVVVSVVLSGSSSPQSNASAAKVASEYGKHRSANLASAILLEGAVFVGLFFFWYLRNLLASADDSQRLISLGFAGAVLFAISGCIAGGLRWSLADGAKYLDPSSLQVLNILQNDFNNNIIAVGQAVFLIATGGVIMRHSTALPKWLGWLGIVLGVLALFPLLGPIYAGVWVLVASIVLLTGASASAAAAVS